LNCTTCKSPIASPDTTTTYTVTAFNDAGCTGTAQVTVNVRPTPSLQPATSVVLCPGTGLQIGADASGGLPPYNYNWSPGVGLSSSNVAMPFANPTATTTYTVEVIDANGCRGRAQVVVRVNTPPSVRPPQDLLLCPGTNGSIGAEATGGAPPYRYSWTPATGLSSATAATPTASPSVPTTYTVHVTDANGCTDSATVRVTPVQPLEIASLLSEGGLKIDPTVVKTLRCRDILLRNPGPAPMTLTAASMMRNVEFSVPPGQLPMTIPAGEERSLQVCFMPDDSKLLRDTLSGPVCNSIIQIRPPDSNAAMLRALPAYPNPATGLVTIPIEMVYAAEQPGDISAVLYDASGEPIAEGTYRRDRTLRSGGICYQTGSMTLSIHGLPPGTYFSRISSSGSTIVVPVIIQR
jgi:hypothetical protein